MYLEIVFVCWELDVLVLGVNSDVVSIFGVLGCETDVLGVGKFSLVGVMESLQTGVAPEWLTVVLFDDGETETSVADGTT